MLSERTVKPYYWQASLFETARTDAQGIRALSLAGTDQLRRAGTNVDLPEMELAASNRRRLDQPAPDTGGWSAFFGLLDRSVPNTDPNGNIWIRADGLWIRADGLAAFDGWPTTHEPFVG